MADQRSAEPPIQTLVNQDAHLLEWLNRFKHLQLARFNDGNDLVALHRMSIYQTEA
jgi:hypothetical protein